MIDENINKIFQIGFNKCGTVSIYNLFSNNIENKKLSCIHWDKNNLAKEIYENIVNNKTNILGSYEKHDVFTDMEYANMEDIILVHKDYFIQLDETYKNSKFILNIRPIDKWIQSRLNHRKELPDSYLAMYKEKYKTKSTEQIVNIWKTQWNNHIKIVTNYFSNRNNDLLIFDIEQDDFSKIERFFPSFRFTVNQLIKKNVTKK
jgi:hypothetical protein